MKFRFIVFFAITLGLYTSCTSQKVKQLGEWTPKIGGCGGIFFDAQKGSLIIEIEKINLKNDSRSRTLRAVFVGPDRRVIQDMNTYTSENDNKKNILRLETQVDRPGTYAVMITVSNDRYGENTAWRFKTNCDKYIIETSRGHKDQYHEEPIVLVDPEREADLCFLPQRNDFDILITGLSNDVKTIALKDVKGQNIALLKVENDTARHHIEKGERFSVPWKLHFSKAQAKVEIEGVTRWNTDDQSDHFSVYPDGAFWTPNETSWFHFLDNRWLLTPHSLTSYDIADDKKSAVFRVHNNSTILQKVELKLEFPKNRWDVQLSDNYFDLKPNEEKNVTLSWKANNNDQSVHLRATSGGYTTYSTLYIKAKDSEMDMIKMPVVLRPFLHEHEQFGYSPDYPVNNQPYFNVDNKMYVLSENSVLFYQNNKWNETFTDRLQSSIAAFDSDGDVYVLGRENNKTVLLHSTDNGFTFKSYVIPGTSGTGFDIEQFTGHNIPDGPPPVMKYTRTAADKQHFWRRSGNLELLIPKKTDKGIEWEQPVLISDKCLGVSSHSGLPSSVVSHKDKIFIVWGEVTDVNLSKEEMPGVPVFVCSYDKKTKKSSVPVLVGFGPPPNDVHNIPGITMDGEGFLHVLTGTHGRPFQYAKSLQPLSVNGGWTKAESLIDAKISQSTQTYLGLVADQNNTLHTIFRFWQHNTKPFPDTHYATLAYMSKKQGQEWSEPQILVQAPLSHYSNFRHRLTIDRKGRLFISYYYWSTYWFYRTDRKYIDRILFMSSDGGKTWKLASEKDLIS